MNVMNTRAGNYFHRLLTKQRRRSNAGLVFSGVASAVTLTLGVYQLFAGRFTDVSVTLLRPGFLIFLSLIAVVELAADLLQHRNLRLAAALRVFNWIALAMLGAFVIYSIVTSPYTTYEYLLKFLFFALIVVFVLYAIRKYGWGVE